MVVVVLPAGRTYRIWRLTTKDLPIAVTMTDAPGPPTRPDLQVTGLEVPGKLMPPALVLRKLQTCVAGVLDVLVTGDLGDDDMAPETMSTTSHGANGSGRGDDGDDELAEMLLGLMSQLQPTPHSPQPISYLDVGMVPRLMLPELRVLPEEARYYDELIAVDKLVEKFERKLKQVFVISAAGKPIYSLHGDDDAVMGYMGVITTLILTFQEGSWHQNLRTVSWGTTQIAIKTALPLYVVAILKLAHESLSVLSRQLDAVYSYFLMVLSKPTIDRNFMNRMNYDLRKVLTPLDYETLDSMCMALTYGYLGKYDGGNVADFEYFISEYLGDCLQNVKVAKSVRTKVNLVVALCKRLKQDPSTTSDAHLVFSLLPEGPGASDNKLLASELLFALITSGTDKVVSYLHPRNHHLTNEDLQILFRIIGCRHDAGDSAKESWIPLCMPRFNANGFLYAYISRFELGAPSQSFTIVLFSGNKNTFPEMLKIAHYIISKLRDLARLPEEVGLLNQLLILRDIKVPYIKHFIYKVRKYNQFIMLNPEHVAEFDGNLGLQLSYYYATLHNTKATTEYAPNRKFSYLRWPGGMTGFMLVDDSLEFYCICDEFITLQELIKNCLKIIKWCEDNHSRLFIGSGEVF